MIYHWICPGDLDLQAEPRIDFVDLQIEFMMDFVALQTESMIYFVVPQPKLAS